MALTEKGHACGFILSEANGNRSRENGILAPGNNLQAGAVLGMVGGDYTELAPGSSAGDDEAVGILVAPVDASASEQPCVVIARDAEVNANELVWPSGIQAGEKTAAIAQLKALGIIVRS